MNGPPVRRHGRCVVAVLASLALASLAVAANGPAPSPPDVQVLADTTFARPAEKGGVHSAIAVPAGGLFAVGDTVEQVPEYLRFAPDGALEWRTLQTAPALHEWPLIALNARDGGYWVLGTAQSKEADGRPGPDWVDRLAAVQYDYLRHIDASGHPGPATILARTPHMHFVYCAIEVPDGYVLAGANGGGPALAPLVPWIEKVDRSGQRVWEKLFAEDHGQEMLGPDFGYACSGIVPGSDGRVTWATPVRTIEGHPGSADWNQAVNDRQRNHRTTFVVQLAADGTELGRTRHYEVGNALVVPVGNGFILLERIVPMVHPAPRGATPEQLMKALQETRRMQREDLGALVTTFEGSLEERESHIAHAPDFYEDLHAVYRTPDGGLLLSGCEQGANYLAFIDSKGRFSPLRRWNPAGPEECARVAFATGQTREQVEMLSSDRQRGVRLLTLRYVP